MTNSDRKNLEALRETLDKIATVRSEELQYGEHLKLWGENGKVQIDTAKIEASKNRLENIERTLFEKCDEIAGTDKNADGSMTSKYLSMNEADRADFFDRTLTRVHQNIEAVENGEMKMEDIIAQKTEVQNPEPAKAAPPKGMEKTQEVFGDLDDLLDQAEKKANPQANEKTYESMEHAMLDYAGISKEEYDKMDEATKSETIERALNKIRQQVIDTDKPVHLQFIDKNGEKTTFSITPASKDSPEANAFRDGDDKVNYWKDNDQQLSKKGFFSKIKDEMGRSATRVIVTDLLHKPGKVKQEIDKMIDQAVR